MSLPALPGLGQTMIVGPWFITRAALEDFARLTGGSRDDLQQQIAAAHFVKCRDDGSEVWRGGKPLRLRFILRLGAAVGGDAPQLVRVEGDHAGRSAQRSRQVRLWTGTETITLDVVDEVLDPSPRRLVAYRLANGQWFSAFRSRARPDQVDAGRYGRATPSWVRELRGQRLRRAGKGRPR